jgi:methionine synthase I (cobalamin-dependent)
MTADGSLYSGADAVPVLQDLAQAGAAAVGFNCVAADMMTHHLVRRLSRDIRIPLLCKPNAGNPVIGDDGIPVYSLDVEEFADILFACRQSEATLLGGCCGTTPAHIAAAKKRIH